MADPIVPSNPRGETSQVVTCSISNMATQSTIDVIGILRGITIFNSLDVMAASGWIDVLDQGNAIEEYSFNGKEIIDIEIHLDKHEATANLSNASDDFNIYKRRFLVYAIENITVIADQMMYRIKFIDPFALMNTDTRISWHFKETKGEDIIKKIGDVAENAVNKPYRDAMSTEFAGAKLSSSQKLFDFKADVSTQHNLDIYVPMMKPFELIRYLADRVVSNDNPCSWSDCLFYQDKKGTFHLNSFKNLFNKGDALTFSQQIADSTTEEKQHLIETYTFNKIYNIQMDKLNGIYGVQFAIADFKPTTRIATQQTVLGTNIAAGSSVGDDKKSDSLSLHGTITRYFGGSLGPINLGDPQKAGIILPFQALNHSPALQSVQLSGDQKQQKVVQYNNQAGALIFLDTCGIIHEDDNTYDEYKRVTLPYVTGCIMKKVLSTYVINLVMNGAFDVDVGKSFVIKLDTTSGPKQMGEFVGDVIWVVSDVRHEWRSDSMQVKTYVTGFTPFLKRGSKFSVK